MLERLRHLIEPSLNRLGQVVAKTRLPPTAWTLIGLALAVQAGAIYGLWPHRPEVGGGLFLLSGFIDIVDGAVARATGRVTSRGGFIDSTLDRLGEVAVYVGIAYGGLVSPLWATLALGLSLLVSYVRARGESLGVQLSGMGIGERAERILALSLMSVIGQVELGVILVVFLAGATFAHRLYRVASAL